MLSMVFLFSFVFVLMYSTEEIEAVDKSLVFRKCCPSRNVLIKVTDNNNSSSDDFMCVKSDELKEKYNTYDEPLFVNDAISVVHGLPNNCILHMTYTNVTILENVLQDHCSDRLVADIVNGTLKQNIPKIVTLSCSSTDIEIDNGTVQIYKIQKCCLQGQSYDTNHHECRKTTVSNDMNWLAHMKVSLGYIFEVQHSLVCNYDEYAVELQDTAYHLSIEGDTLIAFSRKDEKYGKLKSGKWCIDQEFGRKGLVAQVCTRNCKTFSAFCVRKCCPHGQHFKIKGCGTLASTCVPNVDENVWFNISTYLDPITEYNKHLLDVMGLRIDLQCLNKKYALNTSLALDQHSLTPDGYMQTPNTLTGNYCVEVFDRRGCPENDVIANGVLCFLPANQEKNFYISFIMITISCVCLVFTLIVYGALPKLRNLHGRTLICHVSMMLLAYGSLARVQHSAVSNDRVCTVLGYSIYFGFVAAFAWLNVMCFDIWWTFGSIRAVKPLRKTGSDCRRFIWYSLYAWSITIVFTLAMFVLDHYPVASILDADIGHGVCWFASEQNTQSDWPHYIFFVIPMGIITCTNFVLWLLTARHCAQVKSEVHRLQAGSVGDRAKRRFRIDRAKYILTGKLWVVMGAGWISELLSTIVSEPQWLWNIVDLCNELQGVFIFLILVVKPKVYYLIRKRLGLEKPDTKNNATSSGRTSSTFLSRTISSDERTNLRISSPNNKQC